MSRSIVNDLVGASVLTVTVQEAVLFPSAVLTVIVAVPADFAVTTPLDETVATLVFDELHVTFLLVAFEGDTVAVSVSVEPVFNVVLVLLSDTPVTETVGFVTVTVQVAVLFPSSVLAVIVVVPADFAATIPLDETVATFVFDELHVTFLLVAFDGDTVAMSVSVAPTSNVVLFLFKDTPVTGTEYADSNARRYG